MATININIDDVLARQFDENCSKKGITAQDAILKFIKKSSRSIRFSFGRKASLERGKSSFYTLREKAQQSGTAFSDGDIEDIITEVRQEG